MKKGISVLMALGLVLGLALPVFAESAKVAPAYKGGIRHGNLEFFGVKTCRITGSTTAVLCVAGEGFVDAICPSGGVSGAYSLAVDSDIAGSRSVTNSDSLLITPQVPTRVDSAGTPGGLPCYEPKRPIRFVNGLVGVQSAAGHSTVIHYHLSSGTNP
jgi:hypothetical protein